LSTLGWLTLAWLTLGQAGAGGGDAVVVAAAARLPLVQEGVVVGDVGVGELAARGLVAVDLGDDWVPRFLAGDPAAGDAGVVPFASTYRALAAGVLDVEGVGPRAKTDRFLELWGVYPNLSVLRARLLDGERHACHDAVATADEDADDDDVFAADLLPLQPESNEAGRRRDADIARLRQRRLEGQAIDEVRLRRLEAIRKTVLALQGHLACDGFLADDDVDGVFGAATARALGLLQRREALPVREGHLDEETAARLRLGSLERDWLALLRVVRERVVDARGLIEDGSALGTPGMVLGHHLDSSLVTAALREAPAPFGAGDVIASTTEAAVKALGLATPTTAGTVLSTLPAGPVAIALPPAPPWHGPHMDLSVTLERGDVDDHGLLRPGATRRPMTTIATVHEGATITLARLPTTVGGIQREKLGNGTIIMKKKASPTGDFVWRRLWAQPAWYAPPTTPDDELLLWTDKGAVVNDEGIGPGYRSAYGLVMIQHERPPTTWQGKTVYGETGIRTHGTGNVRSIFRGGPSHGCHRQLPLHVGRLASFLLAHRPHRREGPIREVWERPLHSGQKRLTAVRTVRGVRYEFDPPIPLEVLEGCGGE
jgi:hypothetical protein